MSLSPCGHTVMCSDCAHIAKRCPTCRVSVLVIITLFGLSVSLCIYQILCTDCAVLGIMFFLFCRNGYKDPVHCVSIIC